MRRLLLLSNSTNHGAGYLEHASGAIRDHFAGVRHLVFVPFALRDLSAYTVRARQRFAEMGIDVLGLAGDDADRQRLLEAEAVFVGGGNSFRLLDRLQRGGLIHLLRERIADGVPYLGASAGTNIAAPTIQTTNDMPIVRPATFEALGAVGFQINPHYVDGDPTSTHMGETREQRITEFLEENDVPVVGLREGSWLQILGSEVRLEGQKTARIFRPGHSAVEVEPLADLAPQLEPLGPPPLP